MSYDAGECQADRMIAAHVRDHVGQRGEQRIGRILRAGVGVLNRSPANSPVFRSINAHLMEEPPTSMPTARTMYSI